MRPLDPARAERLDCVQANLAVLADHHHGRDTHLNLGAALRLRWRVGADGLPTVEPTLDDQLADARELLGLAVREDTTLTGAELAAAAESGSPVYAVADAFELPWVPYCGHKHMEHSFLLVSGGTVVDAYANKTQWGPAIPGTWDFPHGALAGTTTRALRFDPVPLTAPTALVEIADADGYLAGYAAHEDRVAAFERLTLETWLLARSRALHAAFRARQDTEPRPEQAAHLDGWAALVEQTYLAYRRVARGRAEPPGVLSRLGDLLAADQAVFGAAPGAGRDERLRRSVAGLVASVLRVPAARLLDGAEFTTLPRFSSFRLVEIVERLESELGAEIDPVDLVPENLHRVDDLCQIIRPVPAGVPVAAKGA
ncbi:acyl carrier protein [Actinokineospora sp. G85]|uniref:acyl carrier protein n=1 Tax=Actinokineospora sp. G85 TaxID=3406626 RepID=UPI003C747EB1